MRVTPKRARLGDQTQVGPNGGIRTRVWRGRIGYSPLLVVIFAVHNTPYPGMYVAPACGSAGLQNIGKSVGCLGCQRCQPPSSRWMDGVGGGKGGEGATWEWVRSSGEDR